MQSHRQLVAIDKYTHQPNSETVCSFLDLLAGFLPNTSTRVIAIEAVGIAIWVLTLMWLDFTDSAEIGLAMAVVSGAFVAILTLLLVISSVVIKSPMATNLRERGTAQSVALSWVRHLSSCATMRGAPSSQTG